MEPIFRHGKICYVEIPALDIPQAIAFYETVFQWQVRSDDQGNAGFDDTTGCVSGMWRKVDQPVTALFSGLMFSIMVDDARQTLDDIETAGGKVITPLDDNSPVIAATFADPTGNIWTIYQHGGE